MKVYRNIDEYKGNGPNTVTIGTFDGIHLGHRKIISRLQELKTQKGGETLLFTFHPHPRTILFPTSPPVQLLNSAQEKITLLEELGVIDHLLIFPFSASFSKLSPDTYIKQVLLAQLHTQTLVIGYDHRFGHSREGGIETLHDYARLFHFEVEEIPAQVIDENNISSTQIREALLSGNLAKARAYLGYSYFISGTVVKGKQLGRTLGYPTANIAIDGEDKLIPKTGVYTIKARVNGQWHSGMMSIGYNPTTDTDNLVKIEAHLFNFDKDIYDCEIKVELLEYLRDEQKFSNLEELKMQLALDKEKSLSVLSQKNSIW